MERTGKNVPSVFGSVFGGHDCAELKAGDIVFVQRLFYKHYGVYIGNGEVVHFAGDKEREISAEHAFIQKTSLTDFRAGGSVYVETCQLEAFQDKETVERALSMLGKERGNYNLLFNNCEHFAYWCKYGKKKSKQVIVATSVAVILGVALVKALVDSFDDK